ncbi:MAG: 4Fe-4S dicluster domain-containing protein [Candidatus Limnocylindria bacterium]
MTRGSSAMTFVYLPISRFAVARSSSVTSAGSGNSAISLLTSRDDRLRNQHANSSTCTRREKDSQMTYVITEPCVSVKDASCVDVCPVDCIYTTDADNMYYIHPDECIDCGACESVCPVSAIFPEDAVPDKWKNYIEINKVYFNK